MMESYSSVPIRVFHTRLPVKRFTAYKKPPHAPSKPIASRTDSKTQSVKVIIGTLFWKSPRIIKSPLIAGLDLEILLKRLLL